jgi:GT2 family glycosyltransferase
VRARDRSVLFSAEPEVVHLRGRSGVSAPQRTRDAYRRSQIAFYAKHHPGWLPFLKVYLKLLGRLPNTTS